MVKPPIVWGNLSFCEEGVLNKKKKEQKLELSCPFRCDQIHKN